jgi:hypothetical protein
MLTPLARRVVSRIRCLNRSKALGAIMRLISGTGTKANKAGRGGNWLNRIFRRKPVALKQPLLIAVAIAVVTLPFTQNPARAGGVLVGVTPLLRQLPK